MINRGNTGAFTNNFKTSNFQFEVLKLLSKNKYMLSLLISHDLEYPFGNTAYNLFFNIIKNFYQQYRELPEYQSFINELQKHEFVQAEIDTIANYTYRLYHEPIANQKYVKLQLVDFIKHQKMLRTLHTAKDNLKSGNFEEIYRNIKETHNITPEENPLGIELISSFNESLDKLDRHQRIQTVPTGITLLDQQIIGLAKGELGFFLSVSAGGKSTVLINVGAGALKLSCQVVHLTLEIADWKVANRYYSILTGIPYKEMARRREELEQQLSNLQQYQDRLHIIQRPTGKFTVDQLEEYLDNLRDIFGMPDLLIVDYDDLTKSQFHYKERRFEVASVYRDLRNLAVNRNIAVWTASQARRTAYNKGFTKTHIGY